MTNLIFCALQGVEINFLFASMRMACNVIYCLSATMRPKPLSQRPLHRVDANRVAPGPPPHASRSRVIKPFPSLIIAPPLVTHIKEAHTAIHLNNLCKKNQSPIYRSPGNTSARRVKQRRHTQNMGVDLLEKEWGDLKPSPNDNENIKRIKEVCAKNIH